MRTLLVEDDVQLGKAVSISLQRAGFGHAWVRCLENARQFLASGRYDAVVLDVNLPDGVGYELLDWLRQRDDRTPVLFLTVRDAISERIAAFDLGADDFMVKPFVVEELISRLRAVIRRSAGQASSQWQAGPLRIDMAKHIAYAHDEPLELPPREFSVLLELVKSAGKVVSRTQLEKSTGQVESNVLEVHIHNLRRKIGMELIQTIRGIGYRLHL